MILNAVNAPVVTALLAATLTWKFTRNVLCTEEKACCFRHSPCHDGGVGSAHDDAVIGKDFADGFVGDAAPSEYVVSRLVLNRFNFLDYKLRQSAR